MRRREGGLKHECPAGAGLAPFLALSGRIPGDPHRTPVTTPPERPRARRRTTRESFGTSSLSISKCFPSMAKSPVIMKVIPVKLWRHEAGKPDHFSRETRRQPEDVVAIRSRLEWLYRSTVPGEAAATLDIAKLRKITRSWSGLRASGGAGAPCARLRARYDQTNHHADPRCASRAHARPGIERR
jgi:hypothetical protein